MSAEGLVIMLHGFGSNGADLLGVAEFWRDALPRVATVGPNAPERAGLGFQWFSLAGISEANRPARIAAARPTFDALIGGIIAENGFADRLDKVVFVGFSQGSIMALDALASGRWPIAGVVAFAGRLASPEPLAPGKTPLLLIHGEADPVISATESVSASVRLKALGVPTELLLLPGVGHTISPQGAARAGATIAEMLR